MSCKCRFNLSSVKVGGRFLMHTRVLDRLSLDEVIVDDDGSVGHFFEEEEEGRGWLFTLLEEAGVVMLEHGLNSGTQVCESSHLPRLFYVRYRTYYCTERLAPTLIDWPRGWRSGGTGTHTYVPVCSLPVPYVYAAGEWLRDSNVTTQP